MWRLLALAAGSCLVAADNLDHVIKLHSTIEDAKLSNQRSRLRRLGHAQSKTSNSSSNHNNPNDPNNPNASHNAQPGGAPNSASTNNNAPPNASASASRTTSSGGQQNDPNAKPVPSEVSSHNTNARKGLNNGIPDGRTPGGRGDPIARLSRGSFEVIPPPGGRGDPIARLSRGSFEVIPPNLKNNLYPPKIPMEMPKNRNNRNRETSGDNFRRRPDDLYRKRDKYWPSLDDSSDPLKNPPRDPRDEGPGTFFYALYGDIIRNPPKKVRVDSDSE